MEAVLRRSLRPSILLPQTLVPPVYRLQELHAAGVNKPKGHYPKEYTGFGRLGKLQRFITQDLAVLQTLLFLQKSPNYDARSPFCAKRFYGCDDRLQYVRLQTLRRGPQVRRLFRTRPQL